MKLNLLICTIIVLNISCLEKKINSEHKLTSVNEEIPMDYGMTYNKMTRLMKDLSIFKEICGNYPSNNYEFIESVKIGKCPNGADLNKKINSIELLDSWGNSIVIEKRAEENDYTLISCGAEWMEIKANQKPNDIIGSIKKGSELSPFFIDIRKEKKK